MPQRSPDAGFQPGSPAQRPQAAGFEPGAMPPRPPVAQGEPGGLPQRSSAAAQGTAGSFAARESAWAPQPSAQPAGAAEGNPFARPVEQHPYRSGAGGQLPQRSPGIAGGPLDGPVGEFNGFTPTRQPVESTPGAGPDMPRRPGGPFDRQSPAPADRPPFGAPGDQSPFGPPDGPVPFGAGSGPAERSPFAPREPGGSPAGESFGSARTDDDQRAGDRPPGLSAFGDQRVRVPGATLTGLPDGPPAGSDSGAFPARGGDESGRLPARNSDESGRLPARGHDSGHLPGRGDDSSRGGSESGGFPTRGGSGNGSFPVRGARNGDNVARDDAESGAFSGRSAIENGTFASRTDPDDALFANRGNADGGARGDAFPARDGAFSARLAAENGSPPSRGGAFPPGGDPSRDDVDSEGFPGGDRPDSNPFRDGSFRREDPDGGFAGLRSAADGDGDRGPGRPVPGQPDDLPARHGFGNRPDEDGRQPSGGPGGHGYAQRIPGASFASAGPPDGGRPDGSASGYAQRVPGASFGSAGSPVAAEPRSAAAVPQPRDPAERPESGEPPAAAVRPAPARGSARPVSASASVPVASRLTPPSDEEVPPPPPASAQSRVYGRPVPPADEDASPSPYQGEEQPVSGAFGAAPAVGPRGAAPTSGSYGQSPENPYARPADGAYGQPSASPFTPQSDGTYGRPPEGLFGARPSSEASPFGDSADGSQDDPFGRRTPNDERAGFGTAPSSGTPDAAPTSGAFGAAPTSGAFGAAPTSGDGQPGRASASARVTPPPPGQPFAPASPATGQSPEPGNAAQFTEFTTDIAGRGRPGSVPGNPAARTTPPDQYSENTTDVSGRGHGSEQPYVPAPALPSMHATPPLENGFPAADAPDATQPFGERPRMGGVFPGPASRATVTPPGPDQTASWPHRPEAEADQSRFDSFKADAPEKLPTDVAKPETPHVRMLPVILGVILGACLIVGLTLGVTWLIARGSHDGGSGFAVRTGDCVKRNGDEAVTAKCGDAGSFEVTAIVDTKEQCPDRNQPYVVNPTDTGRSQVLCLKPRG